MATKLDTDIDAIQDAVEQRDLQTQTRTQKGNGLYKEMMRLAGIGKSLFADTNEAKYNDYVMLEQRGSDDGNDAPPDATT